MEGKRVISHRYGLTKQSPIGLGRAMRLMNPCYMQCATHGYSLEGPNTCFFFFFWWEGPNTGWIETYHPNTHKWGLTSYKISIKSNTLGSEFSFQRSNFCGLWLANCLVSEEKIVTSLLKVSKTKYPTNTTVFFLFRLLYLHSITSYTIIMSLTLCCIFQHIQQVVQYTSMSF